MILYPPGRVARPFLRDAPGGQGWARPTEKPSSDRADGVLGCRLRVRIHVSHPIALDTVTCRYPSDSG